MLSEATLPVIMMLLVTSGSFVLSGLVYWHGPKNHANVFFSLTAFFAGSWAFLGAVRSYYFFSFGELPIFLTGLSLLLSISIFYSFLLFCDSLDSGRLAMNRAWLASSFFIYCLVLGSIFIPGFVLKDVGPATTYLSPVSDWNTGFYQIWLPAALLFYFSALVRLFQFYRAAGEQMKKQQFGTVLIAGVSGGLFGLLFAVFGGWIPALAQTYWLGKVGVFLFIFFCAYAVLRFNLFNLKKIVVQFAIFTLLALLLIDMIASNSLEERVVVGMLLIFTSFFGVILSQAFEREVTQRERLDELQGRIKKMNRKLEALDQRKTEFVSLASHQLRTPLTAIKGYASMLLEGSFGTFEGKARKSIDDIFRQSQSLEQSVQNLLAASRIEQGRIEYQFQEIDFKELAEEIFQTWRPHAEKKGLKMRFESVPGEFMIQGEREKLLQALAGVVENAVRFTENGRVVLLLSNDSARGLLRFSVSDTGVGMTSEETRRLFDGFRAKPQSEDEAAEADTGLGLYIAHKFITDHDGLVWAESSGRGKGSTFFIEIPISSGGEQNDEHTKNNHER